MASNRRRCTIAWLGLGLLLLGPGLAGTHNAAVRPVTLSNTVGLPAGAPPDGYWDPIFRETGLGAHPLPAVETLVDGARIQPYYNCEVYAVRPGLGICTEWARALPVSSGYPFNQPARLPASRRCTALNDLSVVIFDDAWQRNPNWMESIEIREPLRDWLLDLYRRYIDRRAE